MALLEMRYYSQAIGKQTAAFVIMPEVGDGPFPVMYLLHGLTDDYTIWLRRTSIERYVMNKPLIVVMPDGGRSFYCDAAQGPQYETALGVELVNRIDRTFPTIAERNGRCVAGLSMGGYGAMHFALTFPEKFAAAVSHSGALGFGHKLVGGDGKPLTPEFQRVLGPDYVGGKNDLFALAGASDIEKLPALRIDCGTEDFLIEDNRAYTAHLKTVGVPHEYEEHTGAHTWDYWDRHIQDSLAFFEKTMAW